MKHSPIYRYLCSRFPRAACCAAWGAITILPGLMSGCATQKNLYDARCYDDALEQLYEKEDPAQAELLLGKQMQGQDAASRLSTSDYVLCIFCWPVGIMKLAMKADNFAYTDGPRVPPGAYADYGFLLFRRGDTAGGVAFFEKEKTAFPESAVFIDKVIDRAGKKTASAAKKKEADVLPASAPAAAEIPAVEKPAGKAAQVETPPAEASKPVAGDASTPDESDINQPVGAK